MSAAVVALAAAGAIGELSTAGATAVNVADGVDQNAQLVAFLRAADRPRKAGSRFGQSEVPRPTHRLISAGAIGELSMAAATAVNRGDGGPKHSTGALLRLADCARKAGGRFGQSEARQLIVQPALGSFVRATSTTSRQKSNGFSSSLAATGHLARARRHRSSEPKGQVSLSRLTVTS